MTKVRRSEIYQGVEIALKEREKNYQTCVRARVYTAIYRYFVIQLPSRGIMRVFMRACVHTQCVHACVHIHPALNAIRCFAGRENRAADCTRIFIRRILRLAERLFAPTSLSPPALRGILWSAYPQSRYYAGILFAQASESGRRVG